MKRFCLIVSVLLIIGVCPAGCSMGAPPKQPMAEGPGAGPQAPAVPAGSQENGLISIIEPEELISQQEAEQLLGKSVSQGEKSEQAVVGQKIYFYDTQTDDPPSYLQISITQAAFMENAGQTPESIYAAIKEALIETSGQEQVDGIGSEYFFGTPGLHIFKDGYYLCIAAGNSGNEKVRQALGQAAALAIGNLEEALGR